MTIQNITSATLLALTLSLSGITFAQAADNVAPEITFDDGQLFQNCMLDGGKTRNGKKTYSCTHDGKTTTCDKKPADKDAPCSTEATSERKNAFRSNLFTSFAVMKR